LPDAPSALPWRISGGSVRRIGVRGIELWGSRHPTQVYELVVALTILAQPACPAAPFAGFAFSGSLRSRRRLVIEGVQRLRPLVWLLARHNRQPGAGLRRAQLASQAGPAREGTAP
jgi:hypothetical protein